MRCDSPGSGGVRNNTRWTGAKVTAEGWGILTAAEKYEARLRAWQEPKASGSRRPRQRRPTPSVPGMIRDALELRRPVRVPISPWAALPGQERRHDRARRLLRSRTPRASPRRLPPDLPPDTQASFMTLVPGQVLDLLDYRMYDWPVTAPATMRATSTMRPSTWRLTSTGCS